MVTERLELKSFVPPWSQRILNRQMQLTLDLLTLAMAFVLAYLLRFDFAIPTSDVHRLLLQLPYVVALQLAALYLTGVYSFIWRYIGISELRAFIQATVLSALPVLLLRLYLSDAYRGFRVPLSIIVADSLLVFGGLLSLRVMRRVFYEKYEKKPNGTRAKGGPVKKSVLLIGAGRAGVLAAREIQGRADMALAIKGFIDDDPQKKRAVISGVRVLGTTADLPNLVRQLGVDHVIISIAKISRPDYRQILNICESIPVKVRTIPSFYEILQGNVQVSRIRDVQIEDLLGREPVHLDEQNLKEFLTDKTIMVTGAGGSIGSELARQVAHFNPSTILLVERAEFALFNTEFDLKTSASGVEVVPLVADISDGRRMRSIFARFRPQTVLHAAAHKHVPMMEFNPSEAVKNNALGTHLLGELAGQYGVETFVLISTDKAVRPKSVMGATKRVAELVVQYLNNRYETRFVAVRFGNVIGSAGSVIPIFREQIQKGGPVTVTHKDMKRYFMTIPEAAQLVLQAGAMGEGGEIFILDMGEPINIFSLAQEIITLSGLTPFEDIDIVFTGSRAGEKLFEELETTSERVEKTRHPKIFIGKIAPYRSEEVWQALARLSLLSKDGQEFELCRFLNALLPEAQLEAAKESAEFKIEVSGDCRLPMASAAAGGS